jgi:hypothetical protein
MLPSLPDEVVSKILRIVYAKAAASPLLSYPTTARQVQRSRRQVRDLRTAVAHVGAVCRLLRAMHLAHTDHFVGCSRSLWYVKVFLSLRAVVDQPTLDSIVGNPVNVVNNEDFAWLPSSNDHGPGYGWLHQFQPEAQQVGPQPAVETAKAAAAELERALREIAVVGRAALRDPAHFSAAQQSDLVLLGRTRIRDTVRRFLLSRISTQAAHLWEEAQLFVALWATTLTCVDELCKFFEAGSISTEGFRMVAQSLWDHVHNGVLNIAYWEWYAGEPIAGAGVDQMMHDARFQIIWRSAQQYAVSPRRPPAGPRLLWVVHSRRPFREPSRVGLGR